MCGVLGSPCGKPSPTEGNLTRYQVFLQSTSKIIYQMHIDHKVPTTMRIDPEHQSELQLFSCPDPV